VVAFYDLGEIADPDSSASASGWVRETFTGSGTSGGFGGAVSQMGPADMGMGGNLLRQKSSFRPFRGWDHGERRRFVYLTGKPIGKSSKKARGARVENVSQDSPTRTASTSRCVPSLTAAARRAGRSTFLSA